MKAGLCDEFHLGQKSNIREWCQLDRATDERFMFMFIIDATITENRQRILRNAKTNKGIGDYNHRQTKQLGYSSGCFFSFPF